ncbi:uncharacterized protein BX663DRAFT_496032 [Cokeromyces recurvatus]|uniref:uncharacterized protein n=1 Tax=Cokeromyces recurvatus TaxID=90255 RepID=UPI00221EF545|nr:uncharacterized protein BX663DRAFT_496032 [Cokeromyces recurvatus]KAI7906326.1 hypothetical protein BX663DRAFT_496032 [Cokeromyces recurvatus]
MAKRTRKGYLWAFDQQDKWDDIAAEKISQLQDISNTYLDWFNNHSTIKDLLSWKRPRIDSKKKASVKEMKENTVSSNVENKQVMMENEVEEQSIKDVKNDIDNDVKDTVDNDNNTINDRNPVNDIIVNEKDELENTLPEQHDENTQDDVKSNESVISVGIHSEDIMTDLNLQPSKEFDEHDDEVQLVVSKTNSKSFSNNLSPNSNAQLNNRLSKMGRPSLEASKSPSALSKEDSPSNMNVVTTARLTNIPNNKIEVSDPVPESQKPETVTKDDNVVEQQKEEENTSEDKENTFKVPEWATSPELQKHLEKQSRMDPDKIFGRMPPIQIEGK